MSFALMGAVLCAMLLTPLGLTKYGLLLGFCLGLQAKLTLNSAEDPPGWTDAHAESTVYRAGATAIAAVQILVMLALAVAGAALVARH